jgi:hypothetical protein
VEVGSGYHASGNDCKVQTIREYDTELKVYRVQLYIRGETGVVKGPKSTLELQTIGAKLEDFD